MGKRLVGGALACALLVAVGGVAPTVGVASSAPTPVAEARLSISSRLNTLDPATDVVQPDIMTQYFVSGRLFRINDDFTVANELAESYEYSEDGLTLTITLKPDLVYSDETPLVAEDVVFAYERQRDLPGPSFQAFFSSIESASAPDDTTVVFELARRDIDLLPALGTMYLGIHPKAMIEEDESYFEHPVSAGPYVITGWVPGQTEWVLEENPNYVGGPLSIQRLVLTSVADLTARVLQLGTGEIDYVYDLPVATRDSLPEEVTATEVPINGVYFIAVNTTLPDDHPLQDINVRRAMSLAVNRTDINERAFQGISPPLTGMSYAGNPFGLFDVVGVEPDLEAARAAMAESAFPDGFSVDLQTWGQRAGWTDASLTIAENLAEIGIEVTVSPVEDAVGISNLSAHEYELQFAGNAGNTMQFFRNMFTPGGFWTDAVGYDNPEVTELLDQAVAAPTFDEAVALSQEAQAMVLEELPYIPITERVVLTGNRLPGLLYEANLPAGVNPWVATLEELSAAG
jgi:peptide/nickel transport system substrate-binding protein